jgi:hypothetical protein
MKNTLAKILVSIGFLFAVAGVHATPINVTVADNDPTLWGWNGVGNPSIGGSASAGNFGVGKEDNETESGTFQGQVWDLEAFVVDQVSKKLHLVGGFDFFNGQVASSTDPKVYLPGHIFVKVGGSKPGFGPTGNTTTTVSNSPNYDYTYAIDYTAPLPTLYTLAPGSQLDTATLDWTKSNPWRYSSGAASAQSVLTSYVSGLADGHADLVALGLGDLVGGSHNILTVDLSFLSSYAAGTRVYLSYTMECGNDSIKGEFTVPDAAASLLLIGAGLAVMGLFGLARRASV